MRNSTKHSKIRAIIIDDEEHARENLLGMLNEYCPLVDIVGLAAEIQDSVKLIEELGPDLLFLDIKLSSSSGFELLELINKRNFGVIFVTAYDNYAIKAIKFSAVDYLLKPINHKELVEAVKKYRNRTEIEKKATQLELLIENLSNERSFNTIGVNSDGSTEFLTVKNIVRLQGESNYTRIFLKGDKTIVVSKTLVEFEELLSDLGFFRVHKTHLVNLAFVKTIVKSSDSHLILHDDTVIPVSRRRKAALFERIKAQRFKEPGMF